VQAASKLLKQEQIMSKCASCDQHNAVIYDDEDMYCHDCYNEKKEIEENDGKTE
jgi:Zn finger protein HypA/HybF involved in hydrogenase expression